jgi:hypothetical protein
MRHCIGSILHDVIQRPIRRSPFQALTVPMLLNFCAQIEGTEYRCFNIDMGIWSALYGRATQGGPARWHGRVVSVTTEPKRCQFQPDITTIVE